MKIKRICQQCGKEIEKYPSDIKKGGNFCSRECWGKWRSENLRGENSPNWRGGKIKRVCQQCGEYFEVLPSNIIHGVAKYCSHECYAEWLSKNIRSEQNPNWGGGEIKRICEECGEEFEIYPANIKRGKGIYCSHKCARKHQKMPTHHTKPELIFDKICKKYGLPYKYTGDGSFWIGKNPSINPDFVECNGKKIAIEIFGYHHNPLRRLGKVTYSRTYEGRKAILKQYGWKLIVFWQEDLEREDAEEFILNNLKGIMKWI